MWQAWKRVEVQTKFRSENLKGKRPLGRPLSTWEVSFKMDLKKLGWEDVDWFHLA
jgi:hypothetical protein